MKVLDYSKWALPLYVQIYQDLREQILKRVYEQGQTIPTELELQGIYNVSRITVRQAVQNLEQEGLVIRSRGRGTVVAQLEKIEEQLSLIKSFTEEMRDRNLVPGTKFAEVSTILADEKLAEIFSCSMGDMLYRVRRVRTANGRAVVLFDTFIFTDKKLPLDNSLYYDSLYQLLKEQGISQPVGIEERFEATIADAEISKALGVTVGAPLMKRVRKSFDKDHRIQEYTHSYYDGANYSYIVRVGVTDVQ